MSSFNKITIIGYLGRDPEMRYTPSGDPICTFSVATTERKKDITGESKEFTTWFRVTIWGKQAEACNQYLARGAQVFVEGRLRLSEFTGSDGQARTSLEVTAIDVQFLSRSEKPEDPEPTQKAGGHAGRASGRNGGSSSAGVGREASRAAMIAQGAKEDDIPF